jgi:hypothetical protein
MRFIVLHARMTTGCMGYRGKNTTEGLIDRLDEGFRGSCDGFLSKGSQRVRNAVSERVKRVWSSLSQREGFRLLSQREGFGL